MSRLKIRAALQTALANLSGPVPSFNIVSSAAGTPATITSDGPHGLKSKMSVTITGHSTNLNGTYIVAVQSATKFGLLHKVTETPITSTAKGVGGVCKPNLTAWDNVNFNPVPGVPYQKVNFMFGKPENPSMGATHYREVGFMQVALLYPTGFGTEDIETRAELIRTAFPRGSSFSKDGVTVKVLGTPEVMNGIPIDESYAIPVRIQFQADVFI